MRHKGRAILLLADGARPDVFRELFARGELPSIQRYLTSVSGERRALTAYPSVTGPTFAPMLTGAFPGECNLPGVRWFDRHLPLSPRYGHKRFRDYYGKGVYLMDHDLCPTVKTLFEMTPHSYNVLGVLNRGTGIRRDLGFFHAPWYYLKSRKPGGMLEVEKGAFGLFMKALEKDPQFIFHYFPSIDALSHRWGLDHPEVRAAYRRLDAIVESMVGMLMFYGFWDDTLLMLTSDHGMSEVKAHFDLDRFLEERLKVCYLPKGFRGWQEAEAISMPSGNSMANLYLRSEKSWHRFSYFEETEERHTFLVGSLLERDEILLAAGRSAEGGVKVRTKKGAAHIRFAGNRPFSSIDYSVLGADPFGYGAVGASFGMDACLDMTRDTAFPDAPFQLLQFFMAPRAGDLLLAAAPGYDLRRGDYESCEHRSTHGSFFPEHMWIPLYANRTLPEEALRSTELFGILKNQMGLEGG